jgi:hypothetical protein
MADLRTIGCAEWRDAIICAIYWLIMALEWTCAIAASIIALSSRNATGALFPA